MLKQSISKHAYLPVIQPSMLLNEHIVPTKLPNPKSSPSTTPDTPDNPASRASLHAKTLVNGRDVSGDKARE